MTFNTTLLWCCLACLLYLADKAATAGHHRHKTPSLSPCRGQCLVHMHVLHSCVQNFGCLHADTAAITGHWNNITALVLPDTVSLLETAELFAKLNVAFYDSNIAAWYTKFTSLFWRPVSAITYAPPPPPPLWAATACMLLGLGFAAPPLLRCHGLHALGFRVW